MSNFVPWGDEAQYKKKFQVYCLIALVALLLLGMTQLLRSQHLDQVVKSYGEMKAKQQWTEAFNSKRQAQLLEEALKPVPASELENARRLKSEHFSKNGLILKNVNNTTLSAPKKKDGGVRYGESTAQVEGTWENISACLEAFNSSASMGMTKLGEKKYLSAISKLEIRAEEKNNLLSARVVYRIYCR